ncbi:MAG TPA: lysozyme inhibitor LprI family protein [Caulobacter sp.]|nr:lysozyme inhibitor LprI family protein [Caulobacter sp.]
MSRAGVIAAFVGVFLLWGGAAQAASFDCKKAASRIEHMICDDPDLNSFDSQLDAAYRGALDRSANPTSVKDKQLAWLKQRDACTSRQCMSDAYQAQIARLMAISDKPAPCINAGTTPEVEACAAEYAHRDDRELVRYIAAARKSLSEDSVFTESAKAALKEFDASQAAWEAFRKAECDAVYTHWSDGTIRGAMYQSCWQAVTQARTRLVWKTWLQFMDSTPPLMPEPKAR